MKTAGILSALSLAMASLAQVVRIDSPGTGNTISVSDSFAVTWTWEDDYPNAPADPGLGDVVIFQASSGYSKTLGYSVPVLQQSFVYGSLEGVVPPGEGYEVEVLPTADSVDWNLELAGEFALAA